MQPLRDQRPSVQIELFNSGSSVVFSALAALTMAVAPGVAMGEPRYISTLVGNGVGGFNGDGLPGPSTSLFLPQHGAFGPDGNFYFADWNSERIRRVVFGENENIVEAVAGEGHLGEALDAPALETRLNHPTGVSFDRQGRMLMACWHNSKFKRLDFATGMVTNIAGTGRRGFGGARLRQRGRRLALAVADAAAGSGREHEGLLHRLPPPA